MEDWTLSDNQREFRVEDQIGNVDPGPMRTSAVKAPAKEVDEGPCLYLGPAGQRCYRPALAGGFCAAHQPGIAAERPRIGKKSKLAAAIAGIGGALWPYIYDFVHQLIRTFHSR